ncbi:MAG TPA: hypothetical protein VGL93_08060 [Streptosporangiaceae bacterium]|jgi:hypothetical protein
MGSDGRTDAAVRELYSLPPGGFVAARDAAAERARADGDRDTAARIRKLHRPTVAAWAVNLLVADAPEDIDDLIDLGDLMRTAQAEVRGADLRELSADRSRRVAGLVRRATALAAAAGHPLPTAAERDIATTLEAALADPDAASEVRAGTLTKALTYSGTGFGGGASQVIAFPANRTAKEKTEPPAARTRDRARTPPKTTATPEADAEPAALRDADARRKADAHREAEARRAARRRSVDRAEQAVEAARRARADARAALDTARERREEAIAERHRLRDELARAERAVTRADNRLNEAAQGVDRAESALDAARTHLTAARAGRTPDADTGPAG